LFICDAYSLQISRVLHLWINNTILKPSGIDCLLLVFKEFTILILLLLILTNHLLSIYGLVISKLIENYLFIHTSYSIFRVVVHFVLIYIKRLVSLKSRRNNRIGHFHGKLLIMFFTFLLVHENGILVNILSTYLFCSIKLSHWSIWLIQNVFLHLVITFMSLLVLGFSFFLC
jgi:hypothetical protein